MALPYEKTTAGEKAMSDLQKILRGFGCNKFGTMMDDEAGELIVQFSHRGRDILVRASVRGYAQAWMKEHPYTQRMRKTRTEHERQALEVASTAVYSIARDWIKGQVMAVETGLLSFEGAFLGQILLPSGKTLLEHVRDDGRLLPQPKDPSE